MTNDHSYQDQAPLLELQGVEKHFSQTDNIVKTITNEIFGREPPKVRAVDGVNLELYPNQVQGVIGESGCGKSTLLMTLMGLYEPTGGELVFDGQPVSEFDKADWKEFRRRVQIIFQDPFNSMDPKFTVRETLMEPLQVHNMDREEERVYEALERAELNPPEKYIDRLPKQLSGGEKQRVSIARALVLEPDVILADEPVSMLDVSTQAAVLRLLSDLTDDLGVSMFYISHDLSTVSYVCEKVNVMYLGRIVEEAPTKKLIDDPKHPYSQALIEAIPVPDPHFGRERTSMQGSPSDPIDLPSGCRFKDRCPEQMPICDERPLDWGVEQDREVACHLYYDHEEATGAGAGVETEEPVVSDDD
jgi:peptide/nickel transport system ATP-binding protein